MSKIAHCESVWMKEQSRHVHNRHHTTWTCSIYMTVCVNVSHFCCLLRRTWSTVHNGDLSSALEQFEVLKKTAFVQTSLDPSRSNPAELHLTPRSGLVLHTAVTMASFFGVLFIIFFILYIIFARISCHWRTVHDKLTYYLAVPVLPNV